MSTRLFDTDGFQRTKKLWHEDADGNVTLETIFDAGPAIEMAKARMNEHRGRKRRNSEFLGNRMSSSRNMKWDTVGSCIPARTISFRFRSTALEHCVIAPMSMPPCVFTYADV